MNNFLLAMAMLAVILSPAASALSATVYFNSQAGSTTSRGAKRSLERRTMPTGQTMKLPPGCSVAKVRNKIYFRCADGKYYRPDDMKEVSTSIFQPGPVDLLQNN